MASAQHSRKPSSRAALPRRTTKGPLDAPTDPLSISSTSSLSSSQTAQASTVLPDDPLVQSVSRTPSTGTPGVTQSLPRSGEPDDSPPSEERDLSFLLDASIYHPLSQLEVPSAFRKPFLPPPTDDPSLMASLSQIDTLVSQCEFLRAAHLAATILISGLVKSTDSNTIFRLLSIRYSCLELSGNLLLAAQEAKALEDLSSAFYYDQPPVTESKDGGQTEDSDGPRTVPHHIMPFALRLQALRLQSIGFSDSRRGVSTLYDTALECREHLASPSTSREKRALWAERLQEVSIRVINALIEMGDLDCAARTLETLKPVQAEEAGLWAARMTLLRIKMGDVAGAQKLIESAELRPQDKASLASLLAVADGRYDAASEILSESETSADPAIRALIKQNLAVAYLYQGEVRRSRRLLEELVNEGYSFQTLTVNLATIYDLSSDKSRDLKLSMISHIAGQQNEPGQKRAFVNADFKL